MNVLVTGGHGFVGSHLTARLVRAGHRVRILARASADLAAEILEFCATSWRS